MSCRFTFRSLSASPLALSLAVLATTWSAAAVAQDESSEEVTLEDAPDDEPAEGGVDLGEDEPSEGELGEEGALGEEASGEVAAPEDEGAVGEEGAKKKGNVQLLIGARYRAMVIPKSLINMFGVDGGRSIFRHGVGGELGGYFGKTADGFMVLGSVWWLGYGLKPTPFKGKNDDDSAWEVIESKMGALYLTVDAMWDHKIIDRLSFNVGAGFGVGIVTGKLYRNEAYRDPNDPSAEFLPDSKKGWPGLSRCQGEFDGAAGAFAGDCPQGGNYGEADRWPVYPWINFQLGLRYQPIDEFVGRFDMGLGSSGIWFGLGADYSLFL